MTEPMTPRDGTPTPEDSRGGRLRGVLQVILVVGVLAAGLIANQVLSSMSTAPQIAATGSAIAAVETVQPVISDTQFRLKETGTVQVRNAIDLSPQVSGRVIMVNPALASGGTFRRGEVLFRLDDADYRANIDRARADLTSRQADLQVERTEADIARREWELVRPGEPIPSSVAREPQLARAEAAVRSAEAALADARLDLNRVSFSLPFDGRILTTTIEVGQNLSAGQSYGRAYDPSGIEVSVSVAAGSLAGLSPAAGRQAIVRPRQLPLSSTSISYPATVVRENAELDAQTRLAGLTLGFDGTVPLLPGDFVDVEISGPVIPDAHSFPEAALHENRAVWVVENGVLARRQPQIISAEGGQIVTLPFDSADGIVVSTLDNPAEGDAIIVMSRGDGQ